MSFNLPDEPVIIYMMSVNIQTRFRQLLLMSTNVPAVFVHIFKKSEKIAISHGKIDVTLLYVLIIYNNVQIRHEYLSATFIKLPSMFELLPA